MMGPKIPGASCRQRTGAPGYKGMVRRGWAGGGGAAGLESALEF
jgi:hypothetical protein